MMPLAHWDGIWMGALVNHLWQSTVAVLLAWLLAWSLRANRARTRYWVWMAASVKFLLPFSVFIAAGEALRAAAGVSTQKPALSAAMGRITAPFPRQPLSLVLSASRATSAPHYAVIMGLLAVWLCGVCMLALSWARSWRQIRAAVRAASPISSMSLASESAAGVPVLSTTRLLEPGVFGIVRPVLLLPESITRHLSPEQLRTVVAHELCHIRRRDNLTAALHMAVTALFWFHPAVWWIEARLLGERERACDEAVLAEGNDTELYAESILSVCKFYAKSPLACVPGVTGGDLKQRIVRIMTGCMARELSAGQGLVIAVACVLTVAIPITAGLVASAKADAQSSQGGNGTLPSFEVTSIRPNISGKDSMSMNDGPARFVATDTTMKPILWEAFNLYDFQFINTPS